MAKSRRTFAVHPGEILRTEFMEPMGVSAYALAKALNFPGIYEVVRGDRAVKCRYRYSLGKVLWPAPAILAESSERLRFENRGRQRNWQRNQAAQRWAAS